MEELVVTVDAAWEPVGDAGPTTAAPATWQQVWLQLHRLVQHLQDTLPDDLVVAVRRALATPFAAAHAAEILAFGVRTSRAPTTDVELTVLDECLTLLGRDPEPLADLAVDDEPRSPAFRWAASPEDAGRPADVADDQVRSALADADGVLGVWRAWRSPVTPTPYPPPRPVYLVEAADASSTIAITARWYGRDDAAEAAPLVEVYESGTVLPTHLSRIHEVGTLVHVGVAEPEFAFADLFDGLPGPDGRPQELVRVSPEEAERLAAYLSAGRRVLAVDAPPAPDLLAGDGVPAVPLDLWTDGVWVWAEGTVHYLRRHLVAPPRAFHAYLRGVTAPPAPPDVLVHLVADWLRRDEPLGSLPGPER